MIEEWAGLDALAEFLRKLREQAGLSGKELAARLGWQASKVSRLEHGKQAPTPVDLDAWAHACHADDVAGRDLLRLFHQVRASRRERLRRLRHGPVAVQVNRHELVMQARLVRHFETVCVPAMLQTTEYARRVLVELVDRHGLGETDVDAAVAVRMRGQQLLYDTGKQFEFLLAEPVLYWLLCSPMVMRGQLDRLQTVIGVPNVRFGIVPLSTELPVTPQHSFQLYDEVALVETILGEVSYGKEDSAGCARILDHLWESAVTGEAARRLINRAVQQLPS